MRESVIFYRSFYEAIKELEPQIQAEVYNAIFNYGLNFAFPENLSPVASVVFKLVKPQLDANIKRYENGKKGAQHGNKGGRPKQPQNNPTETPNKPLTNPSETPKVKDKDKDKENGNVKEKKKITDERFFVFWDKYQKKVDREKCEKKWCQLSEAEKQEALDHVDKYVRATPEKKYRKNPLTYLNGKVWKDEEVPGENNKPERTMEDILTQKFAM